MTLAKGRSAVTAQAGERTYQFRALTDMWTGSVDGKTGELVTISLLGSIP
jgi:hypothetical protein